MPAKKSLVRLEKKKGKPTKNLQTPYYRDQEAFVQELTKRLPYLFKNKDLLKLALTHSSMGYEMRRRFEDNQRLEYLGDAVLQLALSTKLYGMFPSDSEGLLTKLRTRLVHAGALARVARQLNLGSCIQMSRGEQANGGRDRENILADAMEAVIGAVFLDGGFEAATEFVTELWKDELTVVKETPVEQNPKGQLQEILQEQAGLPPSYRIIHSEGPDHLKTFSAVVSWNGMDLGSGTGKSKKEAQIAAALQALKSPTILQFVESKEKKKGKANRDSETQTARKNLKKSNGKRKIDYVSKTSHTAPIVVQNQKKKKPLKSEKIHKSLL